MKYNNLAILLLLTACLTACTDEGSTDPDLSADVTETTDVVDTVDVTDTPDTEDVVDVPDEVGTTDTTEDVDDGGGEILTDPPPNDELDFPCQPGDESPLNFWLCHDSRYIYKCEDDEAVQWQVCPNDAQLCSSDFSGCMTGSKLPDCPASGFHEVCAGEAPDGYGYSANCEGGEVTGAGLCFDDRPYCVNGVCSAEE